MLATSLLDVVKVIVLGALGFLVVVVVCAVILAFLQLILPKTDAGAEAAAKRAEAEAEAGDDPDLAPGAPEPGIEGPPALDTEVDA